LVGAQFYLEFKCRKKKSFSFVSFPESFFIKPAKLGFFDLQARWVLLFFFFFIFFSPNKAMGENG
jgi:hypothetical protein